MHRQALDLLRSQMAAPPSYRPDAHQGTTPESRGRLRFSLRLSREIGTVVTSMRALAFRVATCRGNTGVALLVGMACLHAVLINFG